MGKFVIVNQDSNEFSSESEPEVIGVFDSREAAELFVEHIKEKLATTADVAFCYPEPELTICEVITPEEAVKSVEEFVAEKGARRKRLEEEVSTETCPGCGCEPGDGYTDLCSHPEGCGYYKQLEDERKVRTIKIEVDVEDHLIGDEEDTFNCPSIEEVRVDSKPVKGEGHSPDCWVLAEWDGDRHLVLEDISV